MSDENRKYAYVGRNAKGKWVSCVVDDDSHVEDTATFVKDWIMDGLIVERTTVERAREILGKTIPL